MEDDDGENYEDKPRRTPRHIPTWNITAGI